MKLSTPEISRISPCNPGEVLQIYGENLKNCRLYVGQPTGNMAEDIKKAVMFSVSPPPVRSAEATELKIIECRGQVIHALLPFEYSGCQLLWAVNEAGEACGVINRPEIWSCSLFTAWPGDRIALFGQCFNDCDQNYFDDTTVALRNKETGVIYKADWGTSQDPQQNMPFQNNFKTEFYLPDAIPAGDYLCSVNNGTGGIYGWSNAIEITVKAKRSLTEHCRMKWNADGRQTKVFDLSSVHCERLPAESGDGMTDITEALQQKIDKVSQAGGGMVLLPAGRFGVSRMISLKPGVVLKGAGMGATTLTVTEGKAIESTGIPPVTFAARAAGAPNWAVDWKPYLEKVNSTPLLWIQTAAGAEDMTLQGGPGTAVMVWVGTTDGTPAEGVFLNYVQIENALNAGLCRRSDFAFNYHGILASGFTNDFTMFRCRVVTECPLQMLPCRHTYMHLLGNHFESSPRQSEDNLYLGGTYDSMIAENTFMYGRRTLMCQQGFTRNYVFQNRSIGVANTTNANEEYMSEFGDAFWRGKAVNVSGDTVTADVCIEEMPFASLGGNMKNNLHEHNWCLIILEGRGFGQYRHIKAVEGGTIYLDEPWAVMPDTQTVFGIVAVTEHNLWNMNSSENGSGNSQFVYGGGIENVVAGHTMLMASGMTMFAHYAHKEGYGDCVVAFNQIVGCDVRYSGMGLLLWNTLNWNLLETNKREYMNVFGNIVRHNAMTGGSDSEYVKNQTFWNPVDMPSGIQVTGNYTLIEKNLLAGFDAGIHIRETSVGNVIADNRFRHNECDILDEGASTKIVSDIGRYSGKYTLSRPKEKQL